MGRGHFSLSQGKKHLKWFLLAKVIFQDQVLLLDGDKFTSNPVRTLNEIEQFLGIPIFFSDDHFDFSGAWNLIHHHHPCNIKRIFFSYLYFSVSQERKVIHVLNWTQMMDAWAATKEEITQNLQRKVWAFWGIILGQF